MARNLLKAGLIGCACALILFYGATIGGIAPVRVGYLLPAHAVSARPGNQSQASPNVRAQNSSGASTTLPPHIVDSLRKSTEKAALNPLQQDVMETLIEAMQKKARLQKKVHTPLTPEEHQVLISVAREIVQPGTASAQAPPTPPEPDTVFHVGRKEVPQNQPIAEAIPTRKAAGSAGEETYDNHRNESSKEPVKVISVNKSAVVLYAKYRTGSTFASAFINYHPKYFFTFEPLHLAEPTDLGENQNVWISEILNCRFQKLYDVWMHSKRYPRYKLLWKQRTFCFKYNENRTCSKRSIHDLESDCASYPLSGTKVILVPRISSLQPLMEQGVKVIHLVRDPRGVISSIFRLSNFHKSNNVTLLFGIYKQRRKDILKRLRTICQEISDDLKYVRSQLHSQGDCAKGSCFKDRYHLVRYEDLATDPHGQLDRMYSFLGRPPAPEVQQWVDDWHGRASGGRQMTRKRENAYGIYRNNSTATAFAWRSVLPWDIVSNSQVQCGKLLKDLGYNVFKDEQELTNNAAPSLVKQPDLYRLS